MLLEQERRGEGWREKWATSELDIPLADTGRMEKNKEEPQEIFAEVSGCSSFLPLVIIQ